MTVEARFQAPYLIVPRGPKGLGSKREHTSEDLFQAVMPKSDRRMTLRNAKATRIRQSLDPFRGDAYKPCIPTLYLYYGKFLTVQSSSHVLHLRDETFGPSRDVEKASLVDFQLRVLLST